MRVCADCKQVLTDAETVCQRCGSTRLMEYTEDGHSPQPVRQNTSGQNKGQNMGQRRPPMANGMNNMGNGPVGQRPPMQGGMNMSGQRPPMQRPQGMGQNMQGGQRPPMQNGMNGTNMGGMNGGQRPQNMRPGMGGQRPPMQNGMNNQGISGQRPQNMNGQVQNPGVNMQKPVNNMNNMNSGMDNMAMDGQRPVAMTQPVEGDLPPKPDVSSMSPKDAKRVLKEWQKRVDKQAKENKKLAKQQQDAAKKVEALRKKGKPVPAELEQLAAGAAIQASRQRMVDQTNDNMSNPEDAEVEATGEVVTMGEWIKFLLMTSLIPVYGFILMVLTALGKKDAKESMREFAKAECAIFIAVFVVQIIIQMIFTIVAGMSW